MNFKKYAFTAVLALITVVLCCQSVFAAARIPKKTVVIPQVTAPSDGAEINLPTDKNYGNQVVTIKSGSTGQTVTDTLYNILCMVVEAEVGSGYSEEAIKAQAVATHSYIRYHLDKGHSVTCPTKTPGQRVLDCVKKVIGVVMLYDGKIVEGIYCRSTGGGSQSSKDAGWNDVPYLQAAKSIGDEDAHTRTLTADYVKQWCPDITFGEDKADWFEILETNSTGYVTKVRVGDTVLNGRKFFYDTVNYKYITLRTNKVVSITYNEEDDTFSFTTHGWGHGVGLSQMGANAYAKEGKTYSWILKHYYTGITLYNLKK